MLLHLLGVVNLPSLSSAISDPAPVMLRPATVAGGRRVRRVLVGGGHFLADLGVPNRGVRMRRAGDE